MLSGQIKTAVSLFFSFLVLVSFTGCNPEKEQPADSLHEYLKEGENARLFLEKNLKKNLPYGFYLPLLVNDNYRLCYLEEEDNFAEWGIRFVLAELKDSLPVTVYTSPVMDGSLKESEVRPVRLAGYSYDFLFYNSGSYFLGSGGGEVYSYLADLQEKTFTPGFLQVTSQGAVTLSLPADIPAVMKEFFVKEFKKDYPSLSVEEQNAAR